MVLYTTWLISIMCPNYSLQKKKKKKKKRNAVLDEIIKDGKAATGRMDEEEEEEGGERIYAFKIQTARKIALLWLRE